MKDAGTMFLKRNGGRKVMNRNQRNVQKVLKEMWNCGFVATRWIDKRTGRTVAYKIINGIGDSRVVSYSSMVRFIRKHML